MNSLDRYLQKNAGNTAKRMAESAEALAQLLPKGSGSGENSRECLISNLKKGAQSWAKYADSEEVTA